MVFYGASLEPSVDVDKMSGCNLDQILGEKTVGKLSEFNTVNLIRSDSTPHVYHKS